MEEHCVICGEVIPEGRQVCPACEATVKEYGYPDLIEDIMSGAFSIKLAKEEIANGKEGYEEF